MSGLQVITALVGIIAILNFLKGIHRWWSDRKKLVCKATQTRFIMPPHVSLLIKTMSDLRWTEYATMAEERKKEIEKLEELRELNYCAEFRITNTSRAEVEDIELHLDSTGYYAIARADGQYSSEPIAGYIKVGSLKPTLTVTVRIWRTYLGTPLSDCQLVSKSGAIAILESEPVFGFHLDGSQLFRLAMGSLFMLLWIALIFFALNYITAKSEHPSPTTATASLPVHP